MTEDLLKSYICNMAKLSSLLDVAEGAGAEAGLKVKEVGDGNLNFVYIVEGPREENRGQASSTVHTLRWGELATHARGSFETNALREQRGLCEEFVPEVYHFDKPKALIFMRFVEEPHLILRKAFIQGMKITSPTTHPRSWPRRSSAPLRWLWTGGHSA